MRSHLPLASTFSIVRPVMGVSISTRSSFGRADSKAVTVWLASARWSVRAARKIVSPSGIYADSERSSESASFASASVSVTAVSSWEETMGVMRRIW